MGPWRLCTGRWVPRNQGWLNFWETKLVTVRKSLHRSCWTELTCQGILLSWKLCRSRTWKRNSLAISVSIFCERKQRLKGVQTAVMLPWKPIQKIMNRQCILLVCLYLYRSIHLLVLSSPKCGSGSRITWYLLCCSSFSFCSFFRSCNWYLLWNNLQGITRRSKGKCRFNGCLLAFLYNLFLFSFLVSFSSRKWKRSLWNSGLWGTALGLKRCRLHDKHAQSIL